MSDPYGYEMRPLRTVYGVDDALRADAPLKASEAMARCREVAALVDAVRKMQIHPSGVLREVHEAMRPFTKS